MLKKAVELGILTIHKTTKVTKGGKGHNVYVFNRYEVQDIQEKVKEKKTPSKLQKIKMLAIAIKKRNDAPFKRKLKYVNSNKLKHCKNTQNTCDSKDEQPQKEKEAIISKAINKNNNNHLNTKRSAYIKYVADFSQSIKFLHNYLRFSCCLHINGFVDVVVF